MIMKQLVSWPIWNNCICPKCGQSGWAFHAKGDCPETEDGFAELGLVLCFSCKRILSVAGLDYGGEDVKYDSLRETAELKFLLGKSKPSVAG